MCALDGSDHLLQQKEKKKRKWGTKAVLLWTTGCEVGEDAFPKATKEPKKGTKKIVPDKLTIGSVSQRLIQFRKHLNTFLQELFIPKAT